MIMIEQPRLTGTDPQKQLQQLQSYLVKTAQQLQWAFDTLDTHSGTASGLPQVQRPQGESFSPQAVFSGIKDLIIKSAEIVDAYSAEIGSRMEKSYTAKSEFGSFQQKTAQTLERDSEKLRQLFTRQEAISGTLEGLYDEQRTTEAYLKTGLLGRDSQGQPLYGLEIGQCNQVNGQQIFDRFARFTANRLSFYDSADVEVAYISDYKLCITNAEVSGSLQLGDRFKIYSGQGLIFQWTGGRENG